MSSTFDFLKIYSSPFKRPKIDFYIGKVAIGTPYFYPRNWVKVDGGRIPVPKKIGFDFVPLRWKWKYNNIRFETAPIWSFVFFKWQIALTFNSEHDMHYWECWLYYDKQTDKNKSTVERIKQAKEKYPCIWTSSKDGVETKTCYWDYILKNKYDVR